MENNINLGIDISKEVLLWTNPSPASHFASQTLNLDLDNFKYLKIIYLYVADNLNSSTELIIDINKISNSHNQVDRVGTTNIGTNVYIKDNSGYFCGSRAFWYNNKQLTFSNYAYGYGVNYNQYCVPYYIYGIGRK